MPSSQSGAFSRDLMPKVDPAVTVLSAPVPPVPNVGVSNSEDYSSKRVSEALSVFVMLAMFTASNEAEPRKAPR